MNLSKDIIKYGGVYLDNKYLILAILGIMGIVAVSGCTNSGSTTNNTTVSSNSVAIQNFAFNPATLTVKAGTKVTWINQDSTTHQVVSDTGVFNSGDLSSGQSFSFTFDKAGNYPYHCAVHPSMAGTIVVQ